MEDIKEEEVINLYKRLGNVWKVGQALGVSGQKVHKILSKVGAIHHVNIFTEKDKAFLVENYENYANHQKLQELADILGRTKNFICRKAKELGLTNGARKYQLNDSQHLKKSEAAKKRIQDYGHPRGMSGKHHTEAFKENQSRRVRQLWTDNREIFASDEKLKSRSDMMSAMQQQHKLGIRSRTYLINIEIGGKKYTFKSAWEFNIALVLETLKINGVIDEWEYESMIFHFPYGYGCRSYSPDFVVKKSAETKIYELKGWVDDKTKLKICLMRMFYPDVNISYIFAKQYSIIEKRYSDRINLWDFAKSCDPRKIYIVSVSINAGGKIVYTLNEHKDEKE